MAAISPETEEKLLAATDCAVRHHTDADCTPDEAIAKAAAEHALPRSYIEPIVHMWNVGVINAQREEGATLLDKLADVPTASTERVLQLLYPDADTLHQITAELRIPPSRDYQLSAREIFFDRDYAAKQAELAIMKMPPLAEAPKPRPTGDDAHFSRAKSREKRLKRLEEIQIKQAGASEGLCRCLAQLCQAVLVSKTANDHLRLQAGMLYGEFGETVIEQALADVPAKKAAAGTEMDTDAMALLTEFVDRYEQLEILTTDCIKQALELTPGWDKPLPPEPEEPDLFAEKTATLASFAGGAVTGALSDNMIPHDDVDGMVRKRYADLMSPDHEARLRQIRSQAHLQNLVASNPHLRRYDSDQILNAFNQIATTAPRLVDQPALLGPAIRKVLAQSDLDLFEGQQLLDLEGKLQRRDQGIYGEPSDPGSMWWKQQTAPKPANKPKG